MPRGARRTFRRRVVVGVHIRSLGAFSAGGAGFIVPYGTVAFFIDARGSSRVGFNDVRSVQNG